MPARTYPVRFQSRSPFINFDFFDILTGRVYASLYFGNHKTDGSTGYVLSPDKFYSQGITTGGTPTDTTNNWVLDDTLTFDIVLDKPTRIDGIAYFNIPFWYSVDSYGGSLKINVDVCHYDGTTETSLVDGDTDDVSSGSATDLAQMNCVQLNIPNTSFGVGDTLRIKFKIYIKRSDAAAAFTYKIAHDPYSRGETDFDDDSVDTMAFCHIPFKVDLG